MRTSRVVLLKTDKTYGSHGFQKGCVFCEALSAYEPLLVRAFIEFYYRDNRFSAQYERGGMLCLPHLHLASKQSLRYLKSGVRLYRGNVIKYQRLLESLSETRQEDKKRIVKVAEMLSGAEI